MPADILRRFGWLIMQSMLFNRLSDAHLYGFLIIKMGLNDKASGCNSITCYKTKLLKYDRAGQ